MGMVATGIGRSLIVHRRCKADVTRTGKLLLFCIVHCNTVLYCLLPDKCYNVSMLFLAILCDDEVVSLALKRVHMCSIGSDRMHLYFRPPTP
jgi:hypothetical protein